MTLWIYLAATGLLVVAGVLKAARPGDTARALAGAVPAVPPRLWRPAVRVLATVEAALGVVAIAQPGRTVAVVVGASYVGFAAWVLWARTQGSPLVTCGCFGTPDRPATYPHAVLDAVAAGGAIALAVAAPSGSILTILSVHSLDGVPIVVASLAAGVLAFLVMVPRGWGRAARSGQVS